MSCCSYRCISCSSKLFSHFYSLFCKNSCFDWHLPAAALMFAVSGLCSHWGHWHVYHLFSAEHFSLAPPQLLQNSFPLWKQNHLHLQLKPVPPCAESTEQTVQMHWLKVAQQRSLQSGCCSFKPRFLIPPFRSLLFHVLAHVVHSCNVIILRITINLLKCTQLKL